MKTLKMELSQLMRQVLMVNTIIESMKATGLMKKMHQIQQEHSRSD